MRVRVRVRVRVRALQGETPLDLAKQRKNVWMINHLQEARQARGYDSPSYLKRLKMDKVCSSLSFTLFLSILLSVIIMQPFFEFVLESDLLCKCQENLFACGFYEDTSMSQQTNHADIWNIALPRHSEFPPCTQRLGAGVFNRPLSCRCGPLPQLSLLLESRATCLKRHKKALT